MYKQLLLIITTLAGINMMPTWAETNPMQDNETHLSHDMDHSSMENMDHSNMPVKDHGDDHELHTDSMPGMNHGTATTSEHDMGGMSSGRGHGQMQGGSAPPDARDPHEYSGGYTLDSGKYALPDSQRLRLADEHNFGSLLVDRLEAVHTDDNSATNFDIQAWYGRDYDRAVLRGEGDIDSGKLEESSTELFWGHAVSAYWDTLLGLRYDQSEGPNRSWIAFGLQGLAPYWFEVDLTAYLGETGRSALTLEAEYELLITQQLIIQTRSEVELYGKDDAALGIGSGLSDVSVGLRLRYEILREFAPYLGVEWSGKFGGTADYARIAGEKEKETRAVAGVRFWF